MATHFAPNAASSTQMPEITPSDSATRSENPHVMAEINILPLIKLRSAHQSGDGVNTFDLPISELVKSTIDTDSWSTDHNQIYDLGGVLAVTTTPQRVQAVPRSLIRSIGKCCAAIFRRRIGRDPQRPNPKMDSKVKLEAAPRFS